MAKSKYVDAYCNFCAAETKFEIVGESGPTFDDAKFWAKCKKCKQTMLLDSQQLEKESKPKVDEIRSDKSETYSPKKSFEIGESIFHESWNDFGIVLSKKVLSNGKSSILVEFQNNGKKKLLETNKPEIQENEE